MGSSLIEAEMLCRALVMASEREGELRRALPFGRAHRTFKQPLTDFRKLQSKDLIAQNVLGLLDHSNSVSQKSIYQEIVREQMSISTLIN